MNDYRDASQMRDALTMALAVLSFYAASARLVAPGTVLPPHSAEKLAWRFALDFGSADDANAACKIVCEGLIGPHSTTDDYETAENADGVRLDLTSEWPRVLADEGDEAGVDVVCESHQAHGGYEPCCECSEDGPCTEAEKYWSAVTR